MGQASEIRDTPVTTSRRKITDTFSSEYEYRFAQDLQSGYDIGEVTDLRTKHKHIGYEMRCPSFSAPPRVVLYQCSTMMIKT